MTPELNRGAEAVRRAWRDPHIRALSLDRQRRTKAEKRRRERLRRVQVKGRTVPGRPGVLPQPQLMTREEFAQWVIDTGVRIFVDPPYRIVPCRCRDLNCHGWRFVPEGADV